MSNNESAPEFVELDGVQYVPDEADPTIAKEVDGEKVKYEAPAPNDDPANKPPKDESPEAKKARLTRQTEQHKKKHPELYEDTSNPEKKPIKKDKDPNKLDYGQKAFLQSHELAIKDAEDIKFVESEMASTGSDLEKLLASPYFMEQLATKREARAVEGATPGNGSPDRGGSGARDTVDYWIGKGELPPDTPENTKLRREVVAAKRVKASQSSSFTSTPVVSKNS